MKKEFALFIAQYELKGYFGQCVAVQWLPHRPAEESEIEFLINYGYGRMDKLGGNVCELRVNKVDEN